MDRHSAESQLVVGVDALNDFAEGVEHVAAAVSLYRGRDLDVLLAKIGSHPNVEVER